MEVKIDCQERADRLRKMLKEAGNEGLTAKEMGELFYGGEDVLSDRGEIIWSWERRYVLSDGTLGEKVSDEVITTEKIVWVKVCRLTELSQ